LPLPRIRWLRELAGYKRRKSRKLILYLLI
jgi:hypothetical protein